MTGEGPRSAGSQLVRSLLIGLLAIVVLSMAVDVLRSSLPWLLVIGVVGGGIYVLWRLRDRSRW